MANATPSRSDIGNSGRHAAQRQADLLRLAPQARHGGWRYPHRSRRHLVSAILWWLVVAAGVTAAVYVVRQS